MAQAALSLAAFQTAYPSAEPRRPAPPRLTYVETVYDPVVRTRAPYPSAMRRARRRARLTALIALTGATLAGWRPSSPRSTAGSTTARARGTSISIRPAC